MHGRWGLDERPVEYVSLSGGPPVKQNGLGIGAGMGGRLW